MQYDQQWYAFLNIYFYKGSTQDKQHISVYIQTTQYESAYFLLKFLSAI